MAKIVKKFLLTLSIIFFANKNLLSMQKPDFKECQQDYINFAEFNLENELQHTGKNILAFGGNESQAGFSCTYNAFLLSVKILETFLAKKILNRRDMDFWLDVSLGFYQAGPRKNCFSNYVDIKDHVKEYTEVLYSQWVEKYIQDTSKKEEYHTGRAGLKQNLLNSEIMKLKNGIILLTNELNSYSIIKFQEDLWGFYDSHGYFLSGRQAVFFAKRLETLIDFMLVTDQKDVWDFYTLVNSSRVQGVNYKVSEDLINKISKLKESILREYNNKYLPDYIKAHDWKTEITPDQAIEFIHNAIKNLNLNKEDIRELGLQDFVQQGQTQVPAYRQQIPNVDIRLPENMREKFNNIKNKLNQLSKTLDKTYEMVNKIEYL